MPATVILPELNRSSPSWTTLSPTAWVILLALICSVPERWRRTLSSPPVALSISSVNNFAPREVAKFGAD